MSTKQFLTEKKVLTLFLALIIAFPNFGQLITDEQNVREDELKKELKDEFFVAINVDYTFRTISENENSFGANLKEKNRETPRFLGNFSTGVRTYSKKWPIYYGVGIGYQRNGVSYLHTLADSSYSYDLTYRYLSFPLFLGYSKSENGFYGQLSLSVNNLFSSKRSILIERSGAFDEEITEIQTKYYNQIHLFGQFNLGYKRKINKGMGLFISAEFCRQLNNTYIKSAPYIRREYSAGIEVGFNIYL